MIEFLRLLGIWNAAIWLGSAVFFVFFSSPSALADQMVSVLGRNSDYFRAAIGHLVAQRFFALELTCAALAVAQLTGEWLFFGRRPRKLLLATLATLIVLVLFTGLLAQPKLSRLNITSHAVNVGPVQRQEALASYKALQWTVTVTNLAIVGLLALYFWPHISRPAASRFTAAGFRS